MLGPTKRTQLWPGHLRWLPAGVAFSDGNATCSAVGRWIETVPTPALQRLLKARLPGTGAPACGYKPASGAANDHAGAGALTLDWLQKLALSKRSAKPKISKPPL